MKLKINWVWLIILLASIASAFCIIPNASAQTSGWTAPFRLSLDGTSWFPDITADAMGHVHVVWSAEALNYRMWDGRGWSSISEIAIAPDASGKPIVDVFRSAVAADHQGYLNLFYYHLTEGLGNFTRAPVDQAGFYRSWAAPQAMGARGHGYYVTLAADLKNQLHAVYIDLPVDSQVADVFYRRSENGGVQWSSPVNLANSPNVGSSRPQLLVDQFDTLHVSWDEGWDRRSGEGAAQTSRYVFSINGGRDWSAPMTFGNAKMPAAQLVVTTGPTPDSRLAVWRTTTDEAVYYQTSIDSGRNWSLPAAIPNILPRPWVSPLFDQYALARDERGIVHLVLVTRRSQNPDVWAVTHLEWNGKEWSRPEIIFEREGLYPEYPRIAIALGNQLHVVWFTRTALWTIAPIDVWHSAKTINMPAFTPVPVFPTATRNLPKPTALPTPTATRFMPLPANEANLDPLPSTGITAMAPVIAGIVAVIVVLGIVLALKQTNSRRG